MPSRFSTVGRVALEAAVVVFAAAVFAFAANEVSPRGLKLDRNYFPSGSGQTVAPVRISSSSASAGGSNAESEAAAVAQRLKDKGLQPAGRAKTLELFHDPRIQQGLIVFVDARNQGEFNDGHIPGAIQLDPYHPEQQLPGVLARCQSADEVVVYCAGGDCEDADSTAIMLRDAGVPNQKLVVYGGGYADWLENHLPVEQGPRENGGVPAHGQ